MPVSVSVKKLTNMVLIVLKLKVIKKTQKNNSLI